MTNFSSTEKELFKAFLTLKTEEEVAGFCFDLMTPAEIEAFAGRFEAAKLLSQGESQRTVATNTGVSIATVTRVNRFLNKGMNGYRTVLNRLQNTPKHTHPR